MPSSIRRIDVAGRDVTEYMQLLLRKSGYVFHTSAEKEVVRMIKERVSYVAPDPKREEKEWAGAKMGDGKVLEYVLPDGNRIKVCRKPQICGIFIYRQIDWRRAFPCPRNSLRSRNHRSRIPRNPPNSCRRNKQNRSRPAEITIWEYRIVRRQYVNEGFWGSITA